jgi:pimeloyl-ACP methyl ester carboxylesterase
MEAATEPSSLPPLPLPAGVTSRFVDCKATSWLLVHTLAAGTPGKPLILFLHGMAELGYSWRNVLAPIAAHGDGFYCVAPDLRGCGRTLGGGAKLPPHKIDLSEFCPINIVRDIVCLVHRLGYTTVHCFIGNDYGGLFSGFAAAMRPDMFLSSLQINIPYLGSPIPVLGDPARPGQPPKVKPKMNLPAALARLDPPRQHYQWNLGEVGAPADWNNPPQGLEAFIESYLYFKSGSWPGNKPGVIEPFTAENLARMPPYYIMPIGTTMPEVMMQMRAADDPGPGPIESWLPRPELEAYVAEYARSGFEGMMHYYQGLVDGAVEHDTLVYANRPIEVPCGYIRGERDWAPYLFPGGAETALANPANPKPGCFKGASGSRARATIRTMKSPTSVLRRFLLSSTSSRVQSPYAA